MNTNYLNNKSKYNKDNFDKVLNEFVKLTEQTELKFIKIFIGHPLDLIKIDMKELSTDVILISNTDVDRGTILLVKDEEMKNTLYQFAKQFPDRVFRGEQE